MAGIQFLRVGKDGEAVLQLAIDIAEAEMVDHDYVGSVFVSKPAWDVMTEMFERGLARLAPDHVRLVELLTEARDAVQASLAETDVSDTVKEYRRTLYERLAAAVREGS